MERKETKTKRGSETDIKDLEITGISDTLVWEKLLTLLSFL
jgi:hypothetical protein